MVAGLGVPIFRVFTVMLSGTAFKLISEDVGRENNI